MFTIQLTNGLVFYEACKSFSIKYSGLFAVIGLFSTLLLANFINDSKNLFKSFNEIIDLMFVAIFSGVAGARGFYVATHLEQFKNYQEWFLFFDGGLSLTGGLLLGTLTVWLYLKIRYGSAVKYMDCVALHAAFFQIFMRLGCLFSGCCQGAAISKAGWLPAVIYTNSTSMATTNTLLAASQLYSSFFSLIIFLILLFVYKRRGNSGLTTGLYFCLESASRFIVDWSRECREVVYFNLTWAQIFGILFFVLGIAIVSLNLNKESEPVSNYKK